MYVPHILLPLLAMTLARDHHGNPFDHHDDHFDFLNTTASPMDATEEMVKQAFRTAVDVVKKRKGVNKLLKKLGRQNSYIILNISFVQICR